METPRQNLCRQFLQAQGLAITHFADNGDVVFRRNGYDFLLHLHPHCPERFALALPAFWILADPADEARALRIANQVNLGSFGATVVCVNQTVTALTELFVATPAEDLKTVLSPALTALQEAAHAFITLLLTGERVRPRSNGNGAVPAPSAKETIR
jgi:hypothetical protein